MANGFLLQSGGQAGGSTTNLVNVDANGNLYVNLPTNPNQAGTAALVSLYGQASDPYGQQLSRPLLSTDSGMLRSAILSPYFEAVFPGAAIDTGVWKQTTTTMTIAVTGGQCVLNSGNSVATTVDAIISSYASYAVRPDATMTVNFILQMPFVPQANTVMEWGLFQPAAHATPVDGILFRINSSGQFLAVCNFAGVETTQSIPFTWSASDTYEFQIQIVGDTAYFYGSANPTSVQPLLAIIDLPTAGAALMASWAAPASAQIYNTGSAPSQANQLKISQVRVAMLGDYPQRDHRIALVGMGKSGIQGQVSATLGSLANYVNSTVPATATLSNTTAGYATLGGQWTFAAVAGAETDYALFAYLVPIGTAAVMGQKYFITGVRIDSVDMGAAVATTDTLLQWTLAVGSTAVSLATVDGAGTKAPRKFPLGFHSFPIGAAVGQGPQEPPLVHAFETPLVANPGEYIHIILKMPVGTATASQTLRGLVAVEGFWE